MASDSFLVAGPAASAAADQGPVTPRRSYPRWHHAPADSWDGARITAAMRDWAREEGRAPRSYDWCPSTLRAAGQSGPELTKWEREHPRWPGSTTVYRYFRSWADALEAAGLPPGPRGPGLPLPERVEIARAMRAGGATLKEIGAVIEVAPTTVSRYLRTHPCNACAGPVVGDGALCKTCATRKANPRRWSRSEVIDAVRSWVKLEGQPPTMVDWRPESKGRAADRWRRDFPRWPPSSVGHLYFGSWADMLETAGFAPNKHYWTKAEILGAIRAHVQRTGAPPAKQEWEYGGEGRPSARTVRMAFGSFTAGVRAAGFEPRGRPWTRDRIAWAFARFEAEHGRPPSVNEWSRKGADHPCNATVYNRYGSWHAAVVASRAVPRNRTDT